MPLLQIVVLWVGYLTCIPGLAQGRLVDKREQAEGWYVPMHGRVYLDGVRGRDVEVLLYEDNSFIGNLTVNRRGRFVARMDIDKTFALYIKKDGYQEKLVIVDTSLPKGLVDYPAYDLFINLKPQSERGGDPFYNDFPSATVRYDDTRGGFYHSEQYLTHLQTKLSGMASSTY